jgi:hypothetical protein
MASVELPLSTGQTETEQNARRQLFTIEATAAARMILGIDNIGLAVQNLAHSVVFYEKLGFLKTFENERG